MENSDLESADESLEQAVNLIDRLLTVADGGDAFELGQYEASTIIALLTDKPYRIEVMSHVDGFTDADMDD